MWNVLIPVYVGISITNYVGCSPNRVSRNSPTRLSHPKICDDQLGVKASIKRLGKDLRQVTVIPLGLDWAGAGTELR